MLAETRFGPTPNGGVRSTIYYRDEDGNPIDKKYAVRAEILEYDAKGQVIQRTYGTIGKSDKASK